MANGSFVYDIGKFLFHPEVSGKPLPLNIGRYSSSGYKYTTYGLDYELTFPEHTISGDEVVTTVARDYPFWIYGVELESYLTWMKKCYEKHDWELSPSFIWNDNYTPDIDYIKYNKILNKEDKSNLRKYNCLDQKLFYNVLSYMSYMNNQVDIYKDVTFVKNLFLRYLGFESDYYHPLAGISKDDGYFYPSVIDGNLFIPNSKVPFLQNTLPSLDGDYFYTEFYTHPIYTKGALDEYSNNIYKLDPLSYSGQYNYKVSGITNYTDNSDTFLYNISGLNDFSKIKAANISPNFHSDIYFTYDKPVLFDFQPQRRDILNSNLIATRYNKVNQNLHNEFIITRNYTYTDPNKVNNSTFYGALFQYEQVEYLPLGISFLQDSSISIEPPDISGKLVLRSEDNSITEYTYSDLANTAYKHTTYFLNTYLPLDVTINIYACPLTKDHLESINTKSFSIPPDTSNYDYIEIKNLYRTSIPFNRTQIRSLDDFIEDIVEYRDFTIAAVSNGSIGNDTIFNYDFNLYKKRFLSYHNRLVTDNYRFFQTTSPTNYIHTATSAQKEEISEYITNKYGHQDIDYECCVSEKGVCYDHYVDLNIYFQYLQSMYCVVQPIGDKSIRNLFGIENSNIRVQFDESPHVFIQDLKLEDANSFNIILYIKTLEIKDIDYRNILEDGDWEDLYDSIDESSYATDLEIVTNGTVVANFDKTDSVINFDGDFLDQKGSIKTIDTGGITTVYMDFLYLAIAPSNYGMIDFKSELRTHIDLMIEELPFNVFDEQEAMQHLELTDIPFNDERLLNNGFSIGRYNYFQPDQYTGDIKNIMYNDEDCPLIFVDEYIDEVFQELHPESIDNSRRYYINTESISNAFGGSNSIKLNPNFGGFGPFKDYNDITISGLDSPTYFFGKFQIQTEIQYSYNDYYDHIGIVDAPTVY